MEDLHRPFISTYTSFHKTGYFCRLVICSKISEQCDRVGGQFDLSLAIHYMWQLLNYILRWVTGLLHANLKRKFFSHIHFAIGYQHPDLYMTFLIARVLSDLVSSRTLPVMSAEQTCMSPNECTRSYGCKHLSSKLYNLFATKHSLLTCYLIASVQNKDVYHTLNFI